MRKQEFLDKLRAKLIGLPKQELEERLTFYSEIIDDRIEDGMTEEQAVLDIGSVDGISSQIIADIPLSKLAKERIRSQRRLKAWEIVLLALGSPIWLSLTIGSFAIVLSLYAVLWSVILSIWAVFASLVVCSFGGFVSGIFFVMCGNTLTGIAMIGASVFCAGVAIFAFFGCKAATRGIILLTKKIALGIKKCFVKKEVA